jgi:hypothetical protein
MFKQSITEHFIANRAKDLTDKLDEATQWPPTDNRPTVVHVAAIIPRPDMSHVPLTDKLLPSLMKDLTEKDEP